MLSEVPEDFTECCRAVLQRAKIPSDQFQFGKTKLFFRAGVVIKLEEARLEILKASAQIVQAYGRMAVAQKWVDKVYIAAAVFQLVGKYRLDRAKVKQMAAREQAGTLITQYANFHVCQSGLVPRLKLTGARNTIGNMTKALFEVKKSRKVLERMRGGASPTSARRGSLDLERKIVDMDAKLRAKEGLEEQVSAMSDVEREKLELERQLAELHSRLAKLDPSYGQKPMSPGVGLSPKPRRPRRALETMSPESKRTLTDLIASPLLQTELEEVVRASLPPKPDADASLTGEENEFATVEGEEGAEGEGEVIEPEDKQEDVLLTGKILQRWLLVSMTVDVPGRDAESCLAQTDAILRLIKKIISANRPIPTDLCAYWLANLTEVVSGLHHFITTANPDADIGGPLTVTSQAMQASFGNVAWAVPVITARERIVRFVEEILGMWLSDLYGKMSGALRTAILDSQPVTDLRSPSPSPSTSSFFEGGMASIFSSLAWGSSSTEQKPVLDDVLNQLRTHIEDMLRSGLSPDLTTKIVECLLRHVAIGCFNQIMLRKTYATWKRGLQIQCNLTTVEEFLASLPISMDGAYESCFGMVAQVAGLLQMAKAVEDVDSIKEACPDLSLLQIRRLLISYQPDRYDDGPVNEELMTSIDQLIEAEASVDGDLEGGELEDQEDQEQQPKQPEDEDKGILLESGGVHFDIAAPPKAPVPVTQLPSTLPGNLYKFFMLTQDAL